MRQSKDNFLKECQLSIRKQRYGLNNYCVLVVIIGICTRYTELSFSSPVDAVVYLQTSIASIVDHTNNTESRQVSCNWSNQLKW